MFFSILIVWSASPAACLLPAAMQPEASLKSRGVVNCLESLGSLGGGLSHCASFTAPSRRDPRVDMTDETRPD